MHKLFSKEKCILSKVEICNTFLKNLKGLMFSRELKSDEALLLDCKQESVLNSSIHMFVFVTPPDYRRPLHELPSYLVVPADYYR